MDKVGFVEFGLQSKKEYQGFSIIYNQESSLTVIRYSVSDLFNLMAIIKNRKTVFLSEIEELTIRKNILTAQIQNNNNNGGDAMNIDSEHLINEINRIEYKLTVLGEKILEEEDKFRKWKVAMIL